jgi:hypothetical protein
MATEQHIGTEKARAGSTPGIVRYVLVISLALAVIFLTLITVFSYQTGPSASQSGGTASPGGTVSEQQR